MSRIKARSRVNARSRASSDFNFATDVTGYTLAYTVDSPQFLALGYGDGDDVTSWPNDGLFSGILPLASVGTDPTYEVDGMGGGPCVEFDGVDDDLTRASLTIARPAWFLFTFQFLDSGDGANHKIWATAPSGNDAGVGQDTSNNWIIRDDANAASSTAADGLVHTGVARLGAAAVDNDLLVIDGATISDADKPDVTIDLITLGRGTAQHSACRFGAFYWFASDPRNFSWFDAYNEATAIRWGAQAWS